jgi:hypothetical protein
VAHSARKHPSATQPLVNFVVGVRDDFAAGGFEPSKPVATG